MTSRLLLVEPSATMRYVLENYVQSLGFSVAVISDYAQATEALHQQFRTYGSDFAGMLLGWPTVATPTADLLIEVLESPDFSDLPVVVMSTDMRAETRAWVAGRSQTAVLPWRDYQALDVLLRGLIETTSADRDVFPVKFDNSDIHILIVDDSLSIRFALKDLFELHGYQVSLAGSHDEAMIAAKQTAFDIAILDYYLREGTGDTLCRHLLNDPSTGELTCAILTGTYADHIIKRSLRAGAVECMFKNESSELLLARIDALSRFVRQRKRLLADQLRLDGAVDALAGATLIVTDKDLISYASEHAVALLGYEHRAELLGKNAADVIDIILLRKSRDGKHRANWIDKIGQSQAILYRQITLEGSSDVVLNFKRLAVESASATAQGPNTSSALSVSAPHAENTPRYPQQSASFITCLKNYMADLGAVSDHVSLLIIDVFGEFDGQTTQPLQQNDAVSEHLHKTMKAIYKREHHVARLGENRFGFILRHSTAPQAYLLTRKIMQLCNESAKEIDGLILSCTGCLVKLNTNSQLTVDSILERAQQGLSVVNARGGNQALLLDLRRMLAVYPSSTTKL